MHNPFSYRWYVIKLESNKKGTVKLKIFYRFRVEMIKKLDPSFTMGEGVPIYKV